MAIGPFIGPQVKSAGEWIDGPIVTLASSTVFDGDFDASIRRSPDIAARIAPEEMTFIDKKDTDLSRLYRGEPVGYFFLISTRLALT